MNKPKGYRIVILEYMYESESIRQPRWGGKGLPKFDRDKLFTLDEALELVPSIKRAEGINGFVFFRVALIPVYEEDLI